MVFWSGFVRKIKETVSKKDFDDLKKDVNKNKLDIFNTSNKLDFFADNQTQIRNDLNNVIDKSSDNLTKIQALESGKADKTYVDESFSPIIERIEYTFPTTTLQPNSTTFESVEMERGIEMFWANFIEDTNQPYVFGNVYDFGSERLLLQVQYEKVSGACFVKVINIGTTATKIGIGSARVKGCYISFVRKIKQ